MYDFAEEIPFLPQVIIINLYDEACFYVKPKPTLILPENLLQKSKHFICFFG